MDKRYNKFKPKEDTIHHYGTMNNPTNPQDNVPQSVKSVDVPPHEQCLDRMSDLLDKMDWIIEKDKALARIAELEARNKELKQLLIESNDTFICKDINDRNLKIKICKALIPNKH